MNYRINQNKVPAQTRNGPSLKTKPQMYKRGKKGKGQYPDWHVLQQLALNVHIKHFDLDFKKNCTNLKLSIFWWN